MSNRGVMYHGPKIRDLTMLTDILPTGFHGAVTAGMKPGSTVYVAGAGPVGLAAAASAHLLGAAVVLIGDFNAQRLEHARKSRLQPIDRSGQGTLAERIEQVFSQPEVDASIDCVVFEANGDGNDDAPASVLTQAMTVTCAAGSIGISGLYVTGDPGSEDEHAAQGSLSMRFGQGWARADSLHTAQTPTLRYNRALTRAILWGRLPIAEIVNAKVISLNKAPDAYAQFDEGMPNKSVIDPHGQIPQLSKARAGVAG